MEFAGGAKLKHSRVCWRHNDGEIELDLEDVVHRTTIRRLPVSLNRCTEKGRQLPCKAIKY